jgi:hypothetical protein
LIPAPLKIWLTASEIIPMKDYHSPKSLKNVVKY